MEYSKIIEQLQVLKQKQQDNSFLSLGELREYSTLMYKAYAFVNDEYIHDVPKLVTCSARLLHQNALKEKLDDHTIYHGKAEQLRHLCSFLEHCYQEKNYGKLTANGYYGQGIIEVPAGGSVISIEIPENIMSDISQIDFYLSVKFKEGVFAMENLHFSIDNTAISAHEKVVFARTVVAIQKLFSYHDNMLNLKIGACLQNWELVSID